MEALKEHHAKIEFKQDQFEAWEKSFETIGPGFAALITLAVSAMTMGAGGIATSAGTKMATALGALKGSATAGFVHGATAVMVAGLCSSIAVGSVAHQGNVGEALKDTVDGENLKQLGISMLAAGCFQSACIKWKIPTTGGDAATRVARFGASLMTEGMVRAALQPGDPGEAVKQAAVHSAVKEAASMASSKIGDLFHQEQKQINGWIHKLMHGVVGASSAKLLGQDPEVGAIGAVIGEMVGESYRQSHPEVSTDPDDPSFDREAYDALVHKGVHLAKFVAATVMMMGGKDPSVAMEAAGRAVENNVFGPVVKLVICGITVAGGVYEAKNLYDIYYDKGPEAAVLELIKLGVITVLSCTAIKYTLKGCARIYPTAELAWQAAVDSSPLMYKVGERCSKAGRGVSKAADKVGSLFRVTTGRGAAGEVSAVAGEASAGRPVVGQALSKETQAATAAKTGPPASAQASVAHDVVPTTSKIPENKSITGHIFKKKEGHFRKDTPKNRALIERVAANPRNYRLKDCHGNHLFEEITLKNKQIWVECRTDGTIRNAGINMPGQHRQIHPLTGFKRSEK